MCASSTRACGPAKSSTKSRSRTARPRSPRRIPSCGWRRPAQPTTAGCWKKYCSGCPARPMRRPARCARSCAAGSRNTARLRADMEPQILVISLPEAQARRRLMRAQLEPPGMPPFRILDALDGRSLDAARLADVYDEAAARRHVGRSLTLPEIGCSASHLAAYREIVSQGARVAVVLEDDALLGHQFLQVMHKIVPLLDAGRPRAILLSHVARYSAWRGRRVDRTHRLYRPYSAYGAHAYVITRAGAQAMLRGLHPVHTVADDWIYFRDTGLLEVEALIPYLVGTSTLSGQSQIGSERFADERRRATRGVRRLWNKIV